VPLEELSVGRPPRDFTLVAIGGALVVGLIGARELTLKLAADAREALRAPV
jgi:hypothetical protein